MQVHQWKPKLFGLHQLASVETGINLNIRDGSFVILELLMNGNIWRIPLQTPCSKCVEWVAGQIPKRSPPLFLYCLPLSWVLTN
jgi:hypothetical protein